MRNKAVVLLSGETSTIPEAEAKALFLAYDRNTRFESPEPSILVAESEADPFLVGARIAYARRVGKLMSSTSDAAELLRGEKVRVRSFACNGETAPTEIDDLLKGLNVRIDLEHPSFELTLIRGKRRYLALTKPMAMSQGWSIRRPRVRPFFHPSAIFPKLARALVNLTRCRPGSVFLDPFSGTGSLPIEAAEIGCRVVACDLSQKMTAGALQNMKRFGQQWLGVIRTDFVASPVTTVDAIATDIPYGRASSTMGMKTDSILTGALARASSQLSSGGRMVLMHPESLPIPQSQEWVLEEEHTIYVHKRLTRAISVLRRQ